jgi:hypothetical protein
MHILVLAQISKAIVKGIIVRIAAGFLHLGIYGLGPGSFGIGFLGWCWLGIGLGLGLGLGFLGW